MKLYCSQILTHYNPPCRKIDFAVVMTYDHIVHHDSCREMLNGVIGDGCYTEKSVPTDLFNLRSNFGMVLLQKKRLKYWLFEQKVHNLYAFLVKI